MATLGPATDAVLEKILQYVDAVRINFSHGTAAEHVQRIGRVRSLAQGCSHPIAVLADLPGPKLRAILDSPLSLTEGQEVALGEQADIGLTEPEVLAELRPGQRLLLDDGRLQARVVRTNSNQAVLRVEVG